MIGTKAFIQRCRVLYAQENSVIESKKTPRLSFEHACAPLQNPHHPLVRRMPYQVSITSIAYLLFITSISIAFILFKKTI